MNFLKKIGMGAFYRARRITKAVRNWRKFGVIVFGSLYLAANLLPVQTFAAATDLGSVMISPASTTVQMGQPKQFTAKAYAENGTPINSGVTYNWFSTSGNIGTVNSSGLYTPKTVGTGNVSVTATMGNKSFSKSISFAVTPGSGGTGNDRVLTSVLVSPANTSVAAGATKQFLAQAFDQNNNQISASDANFTWSTSGSAIGTISNNGLLTANIKGSYLDGVRVSATYNNKTLSNQADVTVTAGTVQPPAARVLTSVLISPAITTVDQGATKQYIAKAYDQYNNEITTSEGNFVWSITNNSGGTVNQSGLLTAGTPAYYEDLVKVSVTFNGKTLSNQADVTVRNTIQPPANCVMTVSPSGTRTINLGEDSPNYTATVMQGTQNVTNNTTITWSVKVDGVTQPGISGIGMNFKFTPVKAGVHTIVATSPCGNGTVTSNVVTLIVNDTPRVCTEFKISPKQVTLPLVNGSASQNFTLQTSDNQGNHPVPTNVTWSVITGPGSATGTVSAGTFTTNTTGVSTVKVSGMCNGVQFNDTATVTVISTTGRILAWVQITPVMPTVLAGTAITYTATAYDQHGAVIDPATEPITFTWNLQGPGTSLGHLVTTTGKNVVFQSNTGISGSYFDFLKVTAHYKGIDATDTEGATFYQVTTQQTLSYVTMTVDRNPIFTNDSTLVRAQAYDNNNVAIPNCSYQWAQLGGPGSITSATNLQVITFSSQSLIGTANLQVTATCLNGSVSTTGSVNIVNGNQNVRVEITPDPAYAQPNTDVVLTARCYENNNTDVTGSSTVTWTMLNTSAGTIISTNGNQATVRTSGNAGTFGSAIQATCTRNGMTGSDTATIILNPVTPNFDVTTTMVGTLNDSGTANCSDDVIAYVITLTNNQNNNLNNLIVSMNVPANTNFLSAASTTGSPSISGSTITWNAGMLGFGQTKSMTLRVTPRAGLTGNSVINASANVSGNEISSRTINANAVTLHCGAVQTPPRDGKGPLAPTGTPWQTMVAMVGGAFVLASVAYLFLKRREQIAYNAQI